MILDQMNFGNSSEIYIRKFWKPFKLENFNPNNRPDKELQILLGAGLLWLKLCGAMKSKSPPPVEWNNGSLLKGVKKWNFLLRLRRHRFSIIHHKVYLFNSTFITNFLKMCIFITFSSEKIVTFPNSKLFFFFKNVTQKYISCQ